MDVGSSVGRFGKSRLVNVAIREIEVYAAVDFGVELRSATGAPKCSRRLSDSGRSESGDCATTEQPKRGTSSAIPKLITTCCALRRTRG